MMNFDDAISNNINFYKNKKVLVTGHTGFKGAWLSMILQFLNADVLGYSLAPESGSLYEKIGKKVLLKSVLGDLRDIAKLREVVVKFQPEVVIHLAAYGFINECYNDPIRAYSTNVLGTVNLLEVLRECDSVKSIVLVSTDKVYENKGDNSVYTEEDHLGGISPYSSSKTCMEFVANDYKTSYFQTVDCEVGIATVRASNVLAGGDHIATRLIPSILRAVEKGEAVEIRNPMQTRPWQSVFDALNGYLTIGRYLYNNPIEYSGAWNIGPTVDGIRTVSWVYEKIKQSFDGLEDVEGKQFKVAESQTLGLSINKALRRLDWKPLLSCEDVIDWVVDFFKRQRTGENEYKIMLDQIKTFYRKG